LLTVCVLVATPVTLFLIYQVRTPVLHAGDRMEKRVCRECEGDGKPRMEEPVREWFRNCPACGGDGEVDIIVPGPERPTHVRGAVADKGTLEPFATYADVRPGGYRTLQKPSGTLAGTPIRFERDDGKVFEIESNPYGLFHTQLPPGNYTVKISARGFQPLEADFEVPVLTEEIWLDEAIIIRELISEGETQARYGFELLAALSAEDWDESRLVVTHGRPPGVP
jgi:hypothetical protein